MPKFEHMCRFTRSTYIHTKRSHIKNLLRRYQMSISFTFEKLTNQIYFQEISQVDLEDLSKDINLDTRAD